MTFLLTINVGILPTTGRRDSRKKLPSDVLTKILIITTHLKCSLSNKPLANYGLGALAHKPEKELHSYLLPITQQNLAVG